MARAPGAGRHVRYHDHVPARRLGLSSFWIDRRHGREGTGATPVAEADPDATFADMASFAAAATHNGPSCLTVASPSGRPPGSPPDAMHGRCA